MSAQLDAAKLRNDLAEGMLNVSDAMTPIFDAADGVKADMERRGWSATAAEHAALVWLSSAIQKAWLS